MDDHKVFQHLLDIENEAAVLVTDAQAEADRRVAEAETQNRSRYDEIFAKEAEALELNNARLLASIEENYRRQLEEYRESLANISRDMKTFSALAENLLLKSILPDKDS